MVTLLDVFFFSWYRKLYWYFIKLVVYFVIYFRSEIDGIDESLPVNDHFSNNTTAVISLVVQNGERRKPRSDLWEEDHSFPIRTPDVLFSTTLERDETIDNFGKSFSNNFCIVLLNYAILNSISITLGIITAYPRKFLENTRLILSHIGAHNLWVTCVVSYIMQPPIIYVCKL